MTYLFLSYAKADKDIAFIVRDLLQNKGFHVWMDEDSRELSDEQWPTVAEYLRDAGGFVLLVSDAGKDSAWLKRELDYAEDIQKPIFPILVQGEGWSHLKTDATTLSLGSSLDIPDDFVFQVQDESKSYMPLPPQIFTSRQNKAQEIPPSTDEKPKRGQAEHLSWLKIVAIALTILSVFLVLRAFIGLQNRENPIETRLEMTRDAADMQATVLADAQTRNAQMIATRNAQSIESTHQQETLAVHVTSTQEAAMLLTAQAGNGILPCEAWFQSADGTLSIRIYQRPSLVSHSQMRTVVYLDSFSHRWNLTEWIVNEDGVWYRIATEDLINYGYVLAQDLLLDDDCPR
jgi:hypothetical protein